MRFSHSSIFLLLSMLLVMAFGQQTAAHVQARPAVTFTQTPGNGALAIPVYDAGLWLAAEGLQPAVIGGTVPAVLSSDPASERGGGSRQAVSGSYAPVSKSGPDTVAPGAIARYAITVANTESATRTVRLSDTLPAGLAYVPASSLELAYDDATRTLSWEGELAPGDLAYVIEPAGTPIPYLDLADFGAVNLCDEVLVTQQKQLAQPSQPGQQEEAGTCDDVAVTFNLGVNGYSYTLYGQRLTEIVVSSGGVAFTDEITPAGRPRWLPDAAAPNLMLAGLWRDVDLTEAGRWHAAILTGYLAGHDVFYAQWHDAPHAADPDSTARHAIAIPLTRKGERAGTPGRAEADLTGHAFYLYDNVAHPDTTAALGYSIGIEDRTGARGVTYAYAGPDHPPQGSPPAPGTTLHLLPVLFGGANTYSRTFTYEVVVNARVPETVANTAFLATDSSDPALARAWTTHYLYVRRQTFLPVMLSPLEASP